MKDWYLKMFRESPRLDDKKNYAKMAGIKFDVKNYIVKVYLREKK
ncbi:hypothetical protein [Vibrio phage vB_VpM-pA2SJ1]|uniref:Uncharacterized protein n=1 Tax=Vibrio phage vB_VpM-pA2SJ1 TaxID=3095964 RepID=A0AAX4J5R9_9CAUD